MSGRFSSRRATIYTIELDAAKRPVRYESIPWTERGHTPPQVVGHSANLGAWNAVGITLALERIALGPVGGGGQYFLEVSAKAVESERCASMVTTRVVRTDRIRLEVQQLEVFRGRGIRDCGGHER